MRIHKIGLAAVVAVLAGVAVAGEKMMEEGHKSFNELDTNMDGLISKAEAAADKALIANWKVIDKNTDDQLEEVEFALFEEEAIGEMKAE